MELVGYNKGVGYYYRHDDNILEILSEKEQNLT